MKQQKKKKILLLGNSFNFHWFSSLIPSRLQGMVVSEEQ